jgi:ribosomal protein L37AE/L43A
MASPPDSWKESDQVAFSRVPDLYDDEDFDGCLIAASDLLERAKSVGQAGVYRVLIEFIRQSADRLASAGADRKAAPACSFCGQTEPDVRLGAGPSVFICDHCVGLFATLWRDPRSP